MLKLKEKFALIDGVGWHEGVGLVKFSVSYKMGVLLSALPTCLIRDCELMCVKMSLKLLGVLQFVK